MIERVFHTDWNAHVEGWRKYGYLSLKGIVDPKFIEVLQGCLERVTWRKSHDSGLWYQSVPESVLAEFAKAVSVLTERPPEKVVLVNNWFLTHFSDHHTAHLDDYWEEIVLLIMLKVPERKAGEESILQVWNGWDLTEGAAYSRKRFDDLKARQEEIRRREPARIRSEVGDVVLFNASEIIHERLFPKGTVHFRLGANVHGIDHPINRDEMMITHSSLTPPNPFPGRYLPLFPKVDPENRPYAVAVETEPFRRFWEKGPSMRFRMRKRMDKIRARGKHIARRLAGK